jgi:hypothetical protein
MPRALAQGWAVRASEIATAASEGDDCRALALASSLRTDIVQRQQKLPVRLRTPLLTGVTALADRITCSPTVATTPSKTPPHEPHPPKPPHHPPGHEDHGDHRGRGHGKGHDR